MKKRLLWITVGALTVMGISPAVAQPDQITLDHVQAFGGKQRPPVLFPHNRHPEGGLSCKDCHHRYEQGKNVIEESDLEEGTSGIRCSECHLSKVRPGLREAFHRQCIDCHTRTQKAHRASGPRLCGECHRWK